MKRLATRLRNDGIDARLDAWHARNVSIPEFMNREVRKAQRVLVVCSPEYRRKVHAMEDGEQMSGVGWEHMLLTGSLFSDELGRDKVSIVLLRGSRKDAFPDFLQAYPYIDLSCAHTFEDNYITLLRELTGRAENAPPLGHLPIDIEPNPVEPLYGITLPSGIPPRGNGTRQHAPTAALTAVVKLESPGFWRSVCDCFPRLHNKMRAVGMVSTPGDYVDITAYLRELHAELENDIIKKIYVANQARRVPAIARAEDEGPDPFVQPIHQVLREILGRSQGGDSASAQLAAVNRKSKVVQNLIKILLKTDDPLWKLRRLAKHLAGGGFSMDATNPFVLWLLCFHIAQKRTWPGSRTDLLTFHVEETYKRKLKDAKDEFEFPPVETALAHWDEYAHIIADRNRGTAIATDELVARSKHPADVPAMIRLGRRCSVLAESTPLHPHLVRFDHHRLQEYFTARYLHRECPEMNWSDKLDAPRWQETLVNLVLMGDGEDAVQLPIGDRPSILGLASHPYPNLSRPYPSAPRQSRRRLPSRGPSPFRSSSSGLLSS